MAKFGKSSLIKLASLDSRLQEVLKEAIKYYDFTILCARRGEAEQNKAYNEGHSKLKYPQSKHNKNPSLAVDIAPWHPQKPYIRWNDRESFFMLAGIIKGIASQKGIKIKWGGDFTSFFDGPHFELMD